MIPTLGQVESLFTAPGLAAAGAAAVSIPIVIHLLWRMRRRPQPWGAMRLLIQAYRKHSQRMRLEQWLLLLVRCLLVLVIGLALSGPVLGGWAARWWSGAAGGSGQVMHLVIDDALGARAASPSGEVRFQRLQELALKLIESLGPTDRVALWQSARPAQAPIATPTQDRAAVREAVSSMQPRYSRSDLPAALAQVAQSIAREPPDAPVSVVLLSEFDQSASYLDEPLPMELRGLGRRARVWALRPTAGVENVQVAQVEPRRAVVLAAQEMGVAVQVRLRRFGQALPEATLDLTLTLMDGSTGRQVAQVKRQPRFDSGQRELTLGLTVPLPADQADRLLALRAQVDAGRWGDALAEDDARWALVEVRRRFVVGLMGSGSGSAAPGRLDPAQWLTLALAPTQSLAQAAVEPRLIVPGAISAESLAELDAAMVLQPESLSQADWAQLARFAQQGGLVWVFTPPQTTSAAWAAAMQQAFNLDWQIALEPASATSQEGLALGTDAPRPEALQMLLADWEPLLRPVRVFRWLPVSAPRADHWLTLAAPAEGEAGQAGDEEAVLLAVKRHGLGAVMLLATALEEGWSNLMTKPLFVPLVHESLRGVLGEGRGRAMAILEAGDQPALGAAWSGATQLNALPWSLSQPGDDAGVADEATIPLQPLEQGVQLAQAAQEPGVYVPMGGRGVGAVAVNVDAAAGDTQAASEELLARWLTAMGPWRFVDESQPEAVLALPRSAVNLGWPLLWAALGLAVLELMLARWFSHALASGRRGWAAQATLPVEPAHEAARGWEEKAPAEHASTPTRAMEEQAA